MLGPQESRDAVEWTAMKHRTTTTATSELDPCVRTVNNVNATLIKATQRTTHFMTRQYGRTDAVVVTMWVLGCVSVGLLVQATREWMRPRFLSARTDTLTALRTDRRHHRRRPDEIDSLGNSSALEAIALLRSSHCENHRTLPHGVEPA